MGGEAKMTTYERVQHFIDKKNGYGVAVETLAAASGYNRTTLSHYLAQDRNTSIRQENAWEMGMRKIAQSMIEFINND